MIIKSTYETIKRLIEFMHHNSACVDVWSNGFDYINKFGDTLLDLLANCNKIENIDYSKFIVYIMLSKFCTNIYIPILPLIVLPDTLKPNYLQNLTTLLMYYKKCITMNMETRNLEIRSYHSVIVENSLIAITFLNIIVEQEYKYRPHLALANSYAYYLCLLF
jgi:hypothetical protein